MIDTNLPGPIGMTDALIDHLTAQDDAALISGSSGPTGRVLFRLEQRGKIPLVDVAYHLGSGLIDGAETRQAGGWHRAVFAADEHGGGNATGRPHSAVSAN